MPPCQFSSDLVQAKGNFLKDYCESTRTPSKQICSVTREKLHSQLNHLLAVLINYPKRWCHLQKPLIWNVGEDPNCHSWKIWMDRWMPAALASNLACRLLNNFFTRWCYFNKSVFNLCVMLKNAPMPNFTSFGWIKRALEWVHVRVCMIP